MRMPIALFAAAVLTAASGCAAESATCGDGLEFNARGIQRLTLRVDASRVRIGGARDNFVRLHCDMPDGQNPNRVLTEWSAGGSSAALRIRGSRLDRPRYRLEVPPNIELIVRVKAGDVAIRGVEGSKDVQLGAGDLRIELGPPSRYSLIDASVWAGDIRAPSLHARKGGLFRSLTHNYSGGKHVLRARVGAGKLTLE